MEKRRINKLVVPLTLKSVSLFSAFTLAATSLTSCRSNKKINNDDMSSSITTSSEDELTYSSEISEEITSSELEENNSQIESTTSNTSHQNSKPSSNITSSIPSNPSNTSEVVSSNHEQENIDSNPGNNYQQSLPTNLTADNINNIDIFRNVARDFRRSSIPGSATTTFHTDYENVSYTTDGEKEFEIALMLLNYDYIDTSIINEIIGDMSADEFKKHCYFIDTIFSAIGKNQTESNLDKYCVDKSLGNDLNYLINGYLNRNDGNTFQTELKKYYEKHPIGNENPWIDKFSRIIVSNGYSQIIDINLIVYFEDNKQIVENNFNNYVQSVYNNNKNKIKTKVY